jgi:thiosulfate/3-mercaptopyruvate sulfurtransferase
MARAHQQSDAAIDVAWIRAHVGDPGVRLVEVGVSRAAYEQGHIPGAILWNTYADLRDPAYTPLPLTELQRLISRSAITPETTVVFYGYAAPLGFWLMKAIGQRDVRLLPGQRDLWLEGGGRWSTEVPRLAESPYPALSVDPAIFASREAVEAAIDDPDQLILDVRAETEYTGEHFWPSGAAEDAGRTGHIPGAVNVPIDSLRAEDGSPRSAEELRRTFEAAGVTKDTAMITYCTIGNRASEAWFDLKYTLGYPDVRVYYDSWAVWGKRHDTPIAA